MATLKELHEQRSSLIAQARGKLDEAEKSGHPMDAETRESYDAIWKDIRELKSRMDDQEQLEAEERELKEWQAPQPARSEHEPIKPKADEERDKPIEVEYRNFKKIYNPGEPEYRYATEQYTAEFRQYLRGERRALQADADASGGYTVPAQFNASLVQAMDNIVWIRQAATVYPLATGDSLGFPALSADPADDTWVSELNAGTADTTMAFGKRELSPHALGKYIKVSNKILRQSAINIDALVRERLAYKMAVTQEKAFLTGTGSQQPLGVFTASADGIDTGRDVTGGATTTASADDVANTVYSLKPQYRPRSSWLMHTDVVKSFSIVKDGNGQYIWRPGLAQSDPDTLMNIPVWESQYAPNTMTTGQYVAVCGDFSFYWIAESINMRMKVAMELYAETDEVGYFIRGECDGMPVLAEAFARLKLA